MISNKLIIDTKAINHNCRLLRQCIGDKVDIMAILKCNAYGLGALQMLKCLIKENIFWYAVANDYEALELVNAVDNEKFNLLILYLNVDDDLMQLLQYRNIYLSIGTYEILNKVCEFALTNPKLDIKIHLEINSGLNRAGFIIKRLSDILNKLKDISNINVVGLWSHFTEAHKGKDDDYNKYQIRKFNIAKKIVCSYYDNVICHLGNSVAALSIPDSHFDMVRVAGILYGVLPQPAVFDELILCCTLVTNVSSVVDVHCNEHLTYGYQYKNIYNTSVGVLHMGYASGLPCYNSEKSSINNKMHVLIKDKLYPVLGKIMMNITMVDTMHQQLANEEVIIFSNNPLVHINKLANACNVINYSIMTNIAQDIPRVYI